MLVPRGSQVGAKTLGSIAVLPCLNERIGHIVSRQRVVSFTGAEIDRNEGGREGEGNKGRELGLGERK